MQDNLISIIVPVCEDEENLDRCVDSLVNQSYENIEIILVDNGSQDSSSVICDGWSEKDNRVKVIHNPKGSLSSAKNAGLDYASGDYISFVNANNFVDSEFIFTLFKNLEETRSDISICNLCRYLENKKVAKEEQNETEETTENSSEDDLTSEENLEEENDNEVVISEIGTEEEVATDNEDDINAEDDDDEGNNDEDDDSDDAEYEIEDDDYYDEDFSNDDNYEVDEEEGKPFDLKNKMIKLLEKHKARSRIVFFEGDDIFDYFFSGTDVIKTSLFGKLYKKEIFKKLRFDEDRIYEDEFIAHKIYLECKKFVRTSSQLYYYRVIKKPFKNAPPFVLKDLDKYYALEKRYNYFKNTKWQQQVLSQVLIQIENIYCFARAGKADKNILNFLKHKFKLYYLESKKHKLHHKLFKKFPSLFFFLKRLTTKKM